MHLHEIHLEGYNAESTDPLDFGTAGSYGNEFLSVTFGEGWQGLTTSAIFMPCGVKVNVSQDNVVDVPWEATSQELPCTKGKILFQGISDGRCLNTYTVRYLVSGPNVSTVDPQPPTPSQYEQFVQEVKENANKAANAAVESAGSATAAAKSASDAKNAQQDAAKNADAAAKSADSASKSAESAAKSAELAQQDLENKGWMYLDDKDNSGTLYLITSDSLNDDVTLRDNGAGVLEVIYG